MKKNWARVYLYSYLRIRLKYSAGTVGKIRLAVVWLKTALKYPLCVLNNDLLAGNVLPSTCITTSIMGCKNLDAQFKFKLVMLSV